MTERLKFEGRVTLTTSTPDGEVVGTWSSKNTACLAGLSALVGGIAYSGVQDIADTIGALPAIITPVYGAIGGPSTPVIVSSVTSAGNQTIAPQVVGTFSSTLAGATVADAYGYIAGTVSSVASDGSSVVLNAAPSTSISSDLVTFTPTVGPPVSIYCALDSTTTTVTPQVAGAFADVLVGSVISGSGITTGTTVTAVGADSSYVQVDPSMLPAVSSTSNALTFTPPGPVVVNCNFTTGSSLTPGTGAPAAPFSGVGVGWAVADSQGILTGAVVASVDPSFTSVTLSPAPGSSYTGDSVIFSPGTPDPTDTSLYNEFPTGSGRTTAAAAASAPAGSSTNATFTWQFQFPINGTSSSIFVTEAGVFLLADAGKSDGNLLNHTLLNPAAEWASGQMLTLSVSIGLAP